MALTSLVKSFLGVGKATIIYPSALSVSSLTMASSLELVLERLVLSV